MFKKNQKLKREEFKILLSTGRKVHNVCASIVFSDSGRTKVGVVVSKKVEKGAVKRNLLKRRIFSILKAIDSIAEIHPSIKSADIYPRMRSLTDEDLYSIAGHIMLQPKIVAEKWGGGKIYF